MMPAFRPLTLDALYALDLPDPEWLVDGIIPLGSLALLSAREKAGKGLLTIDLCGSVAGGEPFLDAAVMEGPAIYCATEENLRDVRQRVQARLGMISRCPLHVLPLNGSTDDQLKLEDADAMERLAGMIAEHEPLLVVLDTLREIHVGAEDSSDDMTWRLRALRQLAHQTNTAIVLNHHQSKAGGFRGSTAIRAACDLELAFTRTDDVDPNRLTGSLKLEGRHGPRQSWSVQFDGDTARWRHATAVTFTDTSLRGRILAVIQGANTWLSPMDITAELTGYQLKTIQNELARIAKESPPPFAMSGPATKGNPRTYRSLNPQLFSEWSPDDDSPAPDPLEEEDRGERFPAQSNGSRNVPGTNSPSKVRTGSDGPRPGETEA